MDNDLSHMRITIWVTFAALALVILFATFPSIDLRFSALFFSPVGQPWPGREPFPEWLRDTLREGVELAALLTFLVLVGNLRLGTSQRTGWRRAAGQRRAEGHDRSRASVQRYRIWRASAFHATISVQHSMLFELFVFFG